MPTVHIKDEADFSAHLEGAGNKLVVVDFFATWCGPCKQIAPVLEALSNEFSDKLVILKVDVDENEDLAAAHNISVMPTFLFFKNKTKIEEFSGANEAKIKELINKHL